MISFEESIDPLTTFLSGHGFSITKKEEYLVEYASPTVTMRIGYASLEQTFYMYIGGDPTSLTELAPDAVKEVFGNNRFSFQSMLTIDNLIRFLNSTGKPILLGNKNVLKRLESFRKTTGEKVYGPDSGEAN